MKTEIELLSDHYRSKVTDSDASIKKFIGNLYDKYVMEKEKSLIDAAATAAGLGSILYSDKIDYGQINDQMRESFELAFPGKDIDSISNYDTDQLGGIISAWKGKYFEVIVRDKLNAGEYVGDIHLNLDQHAKLAENPIQEGWDLQIFNEDGTMAYELQLKATKSLGYVGEALEKYPDIDIMTTEEVSGGIEGLFNSGINEADLETAIISPMEDLLDSTLENVAEGIFTGLPFFLISVREGRKVLVGKQTINQGFQNSLKSSKKTGVAMAVGITLTALGTPREVTIIATTGVRYAMDQNDRVEEVKLTFTKEGRNIRPLLDKYHI